MEVVTGVSVSPCEVVWEGGCILVGVEVSSAESSGLSVGVESVVRRMVEFGCDLDAVTEVFVERLLPCQSFEGEVVETVRKRCAALGFEVVEATLDVSTLDVAPEVGVLYVGTGTDEGLAAEVRGMP